MKKTINHFSFLTVGKTQESTEGSFKKYTGVASSYILAVNPDKDTLDKLMGYESKEEPVYMGEDEQGKFTDVVFIVRTDPASNKGIELTAKASIRMRPIAAANQDNTKGQVIDQYGNFTWGDMATIDTGATIPHAQKLDKYTKACVGQCALVDLLKKFLNTPDAYDYKNDVWVKKPEDKAKEGVFMLEHLGDYFKGDVSEIREAIALQPKNKIKLLYGVRIKDGKQYQTVCTNEGFILNNAAGSKGYAKLERDLASAKAGGRFANVEYKVQELREFNVTPTDLNSPEEASAAAGIKADTSATGNVPWES